MIDMFANDSMIRIGTSSWSSRDWVGRFYPERTPPERFIEHYATIYDTVEIDATFYRMPTARNVDAWRRRTPDGFTFAAKTPRIITHDKVLLDADDDMALFIDTIGGLGDRLGPVLLQFPYFNKKAFSQKEAFFERLDTFLGTLPADLQVAVEVRNKVWVGDTLLAICQSHGATLAWVAQAWMPPARDWLRLLDRITTDVIYIRWLGDHKAIEKITKTWDKLVIDRSDLIADWADVIHAIRARDIGVNGYFNNHFAGHAPESVEMLREALLQHPLRT